MEPKQINLLFFRKKCPKESKISKNICFASTSDIDTRSKSQKEIFIFNAYFNYRLSYPELLIVF